MNRVGAVATVEVIVAAAAVDMIVAAAAVDRIVAVAAVEIVIGVAADDEAVGEVFQELRHRQVDARDIEEDMLGVGERDPGDLAGRREVARAGGKPRCR